MFEDKVSIVRGSLQRYGRSGWQWTIVTTDWEGVTIMQPYRTNEAGEGLWVVGSYKGRWAGNYEDHQSRGTCQFTLSDDKDRARRQIRKYFKS